jgi:hypothetical protein
VAFGRHAELGLVAATTSADSNAIAVVTLEHFGFQYREELQVHVLPPQMLWLDAVAAAARVTRLLSGLGLAVVATPEIEESARAVANQASAGPHLPLGPVPVAHTTAARTAPGPAPARHR